MIHRFEAFVSGITICYKYIQRIKSMEMEELGLKGTHAMCLFYLHLNPEGLTATQLSTLCGEDKAAISRTISDLRQQGFVCQEPEKSYRASLLLTQKGRSVAEKVDQLIESWVTAGGDGLNEQQRNDFYQSLALISSNLKNKMDSSK